MTSTMIPAGPTDLGSIASGSAAAGGSAAEQAYRRAVKDFTRAQRQLARDAAGGAGEDVVKADQVAVQMAAAAVARAQAAMAREAQDARPSQGQPRAGQRDGRAPGSAAPLEAAVSAAIAVDTYA